MPDAARRVRLRRRQVVKLVAASDQRAELKQRGLPTERIVRLVSGELAVRATSLLEETLYPAAEFGAVYHWRWHHETHHQMRKGRLDWENWSGQTAAAVRQDVPAAVRVSNVESVSSQAARAALSAEDGARQYPARVNRAVS